MWLKTWEDTETFDDILSPGEVDIIKWAEKNSEARCPYLRKAGENWYFCGAGPCEGASDRPSYDNPAYQHHVDAAELQLWCMGEYQKCIKFKQAAVHQLD